MFVICCFGLHNERKSDKDKLCLIAYVDSIFVKKKSNGA